jgi:hypothetical protein
MPEDYDSSQEREDVSDEEHEDEDDEYDLKMFGISRALPVPDSQPRWIGEGESHGPMQS